jgi:hypothetical protein
VWLPWQTAAVLCAVIAVLAAWLRGLTPRWAGVVYAFARETSIILALYTVWQIAQHLSLMQVDGALSRGEWLWRLERRLHLPSELAMQRQLLPHSLFVQLSNAYYAIVHVPALGVFLVWLFTRHRDRYPTVRNVIAMSTMACLLIQLIPLAPPRLLPHLGFVDTGAKYHQSVYTELGRGASAQLSAMPSVHIAWALLIGVAVAGISTSRWRWIGMLHFALTSYVVVVTANHWWLDGVVAAAVVVLSAAAVLAVDATLRRAPAATGATAVDTEAVGEWVRNTA